MERQQNQVKQKKWNQFKQQNQELYEREDRTNRTPFQQLPQVLTSSDFVRSFQSTHISASLMGSWEAQGIRTIISLKAREEQRCTDQR